jgi:hypothetical protein
LPAYRASIHFDYRAISAFVDLMMAVLARYEGLTIVNDVDLPVEPLDYINFMKRKKKKVLNVVFFTVYQRATSRHLVCCYRILPAPSSSGSR